VLCRDRQVSQGLVLDRTAGLDAIAETDGEQRPGFEDFAKQSADAESGAAQLVVKRGDRLSLVIGVSVVSGFYRLSVSLAWLIRTVLCSRRGLPGRRLYS
jgi:hypothetical protein